jgi:hypothetical protein
MSVSQELLSAIEAWKVEDEKFTEGNNAAGTRARKALQEVSVNWLRHVEPRLPKRRTPVRQLLDPNRMLSLIPI